MAFLAAEVIFLSIILRRVFLQNFSRKLSGRNLGFLPGVEIPRVQFGFHPTDLLEVLDSGFLVNWIWRPFFLNLATVFGLGLLGEVMVGMASTTGAPSTAERVRKDTMSSVFDDM